MNFYKKATALFLLFVGVFGCAPSKKESTDKKNTSLDTSSLKSGTVFYQCPMDREVLSSDSTMECTNCGMALKKVVKN